MFAVNVDIDTNISINESDINNFIFENNEVVNIEVTYVIDSPAEIKEEVITEYPNGGKDVQEIIVRPEIGHFEIVYANDKSPVPYQLQDPGYILKDGYTYNDTLNIQYYRRLTEDEKQKMQEEEEKQRKETEARHEFINTGADRLDSVEETQDDIVLLLADIVGGAV